MAICCKLCKETLMPNVLRRFVRKDIALSSLALLSSCAADDTAPLATRDPALTLLSFNLHCRLGSNPESRMRDIANVIQNYRIGGRAIEVVALQEDCRAPGSNAPSSAEEIVTHLNRADPEKRWVAKTASNYLAWDGRWLEGVAILSRWPVVTTAHIQLPEPPPNARLFRRGALVARISTPVGLVDVATVHLNLRPAHGKPEEQRLRELRALLQEMGGSRFGKPADARILAGDFNATESSETYSEALALGMRDSAGAKAEATFPSTNPVARIDHVFTCAGLRATQADILFRYPLPMGEYASDHRGVVRTLTPSSPR